LSSLTAKIAEYTAASGGDRLPEGIRERTKKVVFDEIACGYFGRRSLPGKLAADYIAPFGGPAEASVLGTDRRAPAGYAALANGTAGHGEEVDGAHVVGGHPGASIVHAAVAMAERQSSTGMELINAVALGYEVGVRIVRACGGKFVVRDTRHLTSDMFYALGCTAAAGRLLGLDARRQRHAFALATFQANGLYALYAEKDHVSKSFCNGQYAFAGISAALMAAAGLEGNEDILGAEHGLLDAWGAEGGAEIMLRGLGEEFAIAGANFKFFNAGYPIHTPVEAAMTVVSEHAIPADAIASIAIGMPRNAMRVVDDRDMHNICVQDMVAAALTRGGLELSDQPFPALLEEPAYRERRSRMAVGVGGELEREDPDGRGARVTITTRGGARFARRIDHPRGHSRRGDVSWDDLEEKWRDALPGCDVAAALAKAKVMETLGDVHDLTTAFRGVMSGGGRRETEATPAVKQ
jgi:2-methylcitrate dehydratase PrpD